GLSRGCEGRIESVPIKFKGKEWELNADIIHHPTAVDIVLGQNLLTKVLKATIDSPKLQMNLSNGELIQLYRESSRTISLCLMAKSKKRPRWNMYWRTNEEKPVPESKWKCKIGPKEYTCTKKRTFQDDPE